MILLASIMAKEDLILTEIEEVSPKDTLSILDSLATNTQQAATKQDTPTAKKAAPPNPANVTSDIVDDDDEEEEEDEEGDVHQQQKPAKASQTQQASGENEEYQEELKVFAQNWVDSGRLPKDFVIDDTLTEEKLDKAVYDFKVETMANERVDALIKEKGLTEEEITKLRGQNLGVDVTMYNKLKAYTELSKAKFDELTDDNEEDIREYLTIYYKDLQIPKKKIESNVEADLQSDDLDDTLKEASKHFGTKSNEYKTLIDNAEKAKIKEKEDQKNAVINREKGYLQSRNIAGFKLSEEQATFLTKALHEKNEIITLADGRKVRTSLYFKKIHEATSDPQVAFLHKIKFLLDDMPGDSPEEKASKGILKGLGKTIAQKKNMGSGAKSGAISMQEIS